MDDQQEPQPGSKEYEALHADDQEIISDTTERTEPEPEERVENPVDPTGGHEDGEIVHSHKYNPVTNQPDPALGIAESHRIVHEKDEDGNVTGWHKEAVGEEAPAAPEEPEEEPADG